jgi:hypothetical protein
MSPVGSGRRHAVVAAALAGAALAHGADARPPVDVRTDDVDRFYRVYDSAHGQPTAEQLQSQYLDPGSQALHEFVIARIDNATKLAEAIRKRPETYVQARGCLPALAQAKARLPDVYARLAATYPDAKFPPVTFVIGRDSTGGTTTPDGILIGLEAMCRQTMMGADVGDRLTHIIAHELAHVQQPAIAAEPPPGATLLFQALVEGSAEFVAELTSGDVSYGHMKTWTRGKECAIEQAFQKDAPGSDVSHWLYNGLGTPEKPGDLAYWVGYRISKAYYTQASDKKQAVFDLLHVDDDSARAILQRSGWKPQAGC